MKISDVLEGSRQNAANDDVLGIEVLLASVLGVDRAHLFACGDEDVNEQELNRFSGLFKRFCDGEPVAYLTGIKEFYGLSMQVDGSVLIPRPETEMLVDKVLEFAKGCSGDLRILDVGTGSGAIAVALAKNLSSTHAAQRSAQLSKASAIVSKANSNCSITATDVSAVALETARKNAQIHEVSDCISFVEADLLEGIIDSFDVVVANLPYIGKEKYNLVSKETVDYEPHVALFGGSDGLELYRRLFEQLSQQEWKPKFLIGEFGFLQGDDMRKLLNEFFGKEWHIEKDYASIERIFVVNS